MTTTELLQKLNVLLKREKELTDAIQAHKRTRAAVRAHLTMVRKEFVRRSFAEPDGQPLRDLPFPPPLWTVDPTPAPTEQ